MLFLNLIDYHMFEHIACPFSGSVVNWYQSNGLQTGAGSSTMFHSSAVFSSVRRYAVKSLACLYDEHSGNHLQHYSKLRLPRVCRRYRPILHIYRVSHYLSSSQVECI